MYTGPLEDHWLRIERREMPLPGLGSGFDGATIAHISDLHRSPIVLEKYLRRCIEKINSFEVDFVAITGDFITGSRFYARRVSRALRHLRPKVATVACLGNHDYGVFHPNGKARQRQPRHGRRILADYLADYLCHEDIFVMLNETRTFMRGGSMLQFVGLEDYWSNRYDPRLAFETAKIGVPTIALCHNPDAAAEVARLGAHWVLAGHTHGTDTQNKFIHRALIPSTNRNLVAGQYKLGADRFLYVNRGLAYRTRTQLNSRPEITIFTLRNA
jgi:predicted MPP superfamily phosphohydrolase